LSYYASNIFGNISRLIHVIRKTGMEFSPVRLLGIPVFAAVLSAELILMLFHVIQILPEQNLITICSFVILCCPVYLLIQKELFGLHLKSIPEKNRL